MNERLLSLVFLLLAGALPLRSLTADWAGRPEWRTAARLLWAAYAAVAVGVTVALLLQNAGGDGPPPPSGPEQFALSLARTARLGHKRPLSRRPDPSEPPLAFKPPI